MIVRPLFPLYVEIIFGAMVLIYFVICLFKKNMRKVNNFRRIGILITMLLIMLRVSLVNGVTNAATNNLSLFFVVDATGSMNVKDVDNGDYRINAVKNDMQDVISVFPGSRYAVTIQDTTTYMLMPVSYDQKTILSAIEAIHIKPSKQSSGSNLSDLLRHADIRINKYAQGHPDTQIIVFIMSDGEDNDTNTINLTKGLFGRVKCGVVIGYGSESGGPVEDPDSLYGTSILKDGAYNEIISRINEKNLKTIADTYGFDYYHHDDNNRGFAKSLKLKISEKIDVDENTKIASYTDTYWLFAIILLVLISWELAICMQKILSERENKK